MSIMELVIDEHVNQDVSGARRIENERIDAELKQQIREAAALSEKEQEKIFNAAWLYAGEHEARGLQDGFRLAMQTMGELLGMALKGGAQA